MHSIFDMYPIYYHFFTTTLRGWVYMHRVHHYPTWMLGFDCIAFRIYVHRYHIRSLRFVSVILHEHSAFTCAVIIYSLFCLHYPTRISGISVHRYPKRLLRFISVILYGHCKLCAPLSHANATSYPLSYTNDPICVCCYSRRMLHSLNVVVCCYFHEIGFNLKCHIKLIWSIYLFITFDP